MKKTFVLRSKDVVKRVEAFLKAQPEEPILEVVIKEFQQDRTLAQNSLMWIWITLVSQEWGWTKNEVHKHFKRCMLVPIYERDDKGYAAMIQAVRKVHQEGFKKEAKEMSGEIVKLTSTTKAKVKQFTEYLKEIEREMIGKGIVLPHPEDYRIAMGIKQ